MVDIHTHTQAARCRAGSKYVVGSGPPLLSCSSLSLAVSVLQNTSLLHAAACCCYCRAPSLHSAVALLVFIIILSKNFKCLLAWRFATAMFPQPQQCDLLV